MSSDRVAVVIVNYQSYDELRTCLTSIEQATGGVSVVVVVDHASSQGQADAIASRFPGVLLLRKSTNDGFAAGVNAGVRASDARWVLLVNPDCTIEADTCAQLVTWLREHPDVAVAGPRIRNADGTVQASARRFPDFTTGFAGRSSWLTKVLPGNPLSRHNLHYTNAAAPVDVDWVSGACMMIRREAFDAIGGMDEGFFLYWEDADLCRRLRDAGWRTTYVPQAQATHIGARSSRHAAAASLEAFHRSAYRLFTKHASAPARLLSPLVYLALRTRLAVMKRVVRPGR